MSKALDMLHEALVLLRGEMEGRDQPQPAEREVLVCAPRALPRRLLVEAARTASSINPANAPAFGPMLALGSDAPTLEPLHIAVLTAKYWGPEPRTLSVSFMERAPQALRDKVIAHMNAWSTRCSIDFKETSGAGDVRISFGPGGYWSYLGTDILHIPRGKQTMNLEGFSLETPDSEYNRVIPHEAGHTLGFPHEHMREELVSRIDPQKAVAYFGRTQGWDANTVQQQVLTPLEQKSLMSTPADVTSIMCYQLPGAIMVDGKPFPGGLDINESDYAFAAKLYPKAGGGVGGKDDLDWYV